MKPSQIILALTHLVQAKRPAFVWGPPGAGKSDIVAQVAKNLKLELRDVRLSMLDSVDLRGMPRLHGTGKNQQMGFAPPDFLPTKGVGILFLDEMNSAPRAVQAAAYQLVLNRSLGDYVLPPGWAVFAAGNRSIDRSVVHEMPTALANRFVHIDFDVDVDDWYAWATNAGVGDMTRAFIKFRPALLHDFSPAADIRAFPTPRSWVFADQITTMGLPADTEMELIKGTVGEGAAAEYLAFTRLAKSLPTAEAILKNPKTAPVPDEPAVQYAVCAMLDRHATKATLPALMTYITRLPTEFQVMVVRAIARRDPSLQATPEILTWISANKSVVLGK